MKICLVVPFGRTDRHDEANGRFSLYYERAVICRQTFCRLLL